MKHLILLSIVILTILNVFSQEKNIRKLYVGTFTSEGSEGIYLCNFNTETGDIFLDKTFRAIDNPSFLKISVNKKYLYAVSRATESIEKSGGFVSAYKIAEDGSLKFLNKQISNGAGPCHVDVSPDGKHVAIATYAGGTTSVYPVNSDGSLNSASSVINNNLAEDNQYKVVSHAHSIKFSPFDGKIYSADLGTDKLNIYNLEGDKLVSSGQKFVKLESGAGPRHFEFHPNGKVIYVINELNSTITTLIKQSDNWVKAQTISTLPVDFKDTSYCADIHISANAKFLYGSNRGHNSITTFEIENDTKQLISKEIVSVEGDWPRNFTLSPDGKFMLVANQKSGNITIFKVDSETGIPEFTGKEIKLPAPVCLEFL